MKSKRILNLILFERISNRFILLLLSLFAAIFGLAAPLVQKLFIDRMLGNKLVTSDWLFFLQSSNLESLVVISFVLLILSQFFTQLSNYIGAKESIISQEKLGRLVYEKALSLRVDAASQHETGEIVSYYAVDVSAATILLDQTLPFGASTLFPFVLAPFVISSAFEIPIIWVIIVMSLISITSTFLALRQAKFFYRFKQLAAKRLGLVNEWIQSIRTIRILGWIRGFEDKIFDTRFDETENRVQMVTNGQMMNSLSTCVTFALNIAGIVSLIYFGKHQATSGELLALLWILGVFLTRPFRQLPWFFTFAFDSLSSIRRLQSFIDTTNTEPIFLFQSTPNNNSDFDKDQIKSKDMAIEVESLNLSIHNQRILKNIRLSIATGEIIALIGEVGSGKSMLMQSLLGQTGANFVNYKINNTQVDSNSLDQLLSQVSYVPQEGFIMSSTLRDNVTFEYQAPLQLDDKVKTSLEAAQFSPLKENLSNDLDTEIGERGVNLSGGQKQRVNMARSFFRTKFKQDLHSPASIQDRSIVFLDDCFSAVDVKTEGLLLNELLHGAWKGKTRLLSTHRLSVLKHVDRIVYLESGEIKAQGTFDQLQRYSKEFQDFTQSLNRKAAT